MSDNASKLRRWADIAERHGSGTAPVDYVLLREAAVEIERLRAELASVQGIADELVRSTGERVATYTKEINRLTVERNKWAKDAMEYMVERNNLVERLPKTADGAVILPGMTVYTKPAVVLLECDVQGVCVSQGQQYLSLDCYDDMGRASFCGWPHKVFSTRAAAKP